MKNCAASPRIKDYKKGRMKLVFVSEEGSVFPLAEVDAEDARDEVVWTFPKKKSPLLVCDECGSRRSAMGCG